MRSIPGLAVRGRLIACILGLAVAAAPIPLVAADFEATFSQGVRAGAAKVDSTWHVGASAGQYASDGTSVGDHGVDPTLHTTRRTSTYGIQGREWVRALVVEGADGTRWALVSNDLYIPQDLVNRRVAGIIAEHDQAIELGLRSGEPTGITPENLTISVSHSHSSPYYSTPSWGVWAFQDVFDIRYFEHIARRMAQAVIAASNDLRTVRMGAGSAPFTLLKRHSYGPATGNDGTPAGYPRWDIDRDLTLVRFDDITDPGNPKPLANWVIFGLHPEFLDGNDLLAAEYVNTMYRIVDREIGGVTLFSQNDTGTAEPARNLDAHPPALRQEFSHKEYAQVERGARSLSDSIAAIWSDIGAVSAGGNPSTSNNVVAFSSDFPVGVKDLRFAPPSFRIFPSVSSCRTERAFQGNPGIPVLGLPDCEFLFGGGSPPGWSSLPFDPGVTYRQLREAGIPIPDNTSAPSYVGLQETLQVHLQAVRLGDVAVTVCPCEQWADQSRNIKTRLNQTGGDIWYGWDWTANYTDPAWEPGVRYDGTDGPLTLNDFCIQNADSTWSCKNTGNPNGPRRPPVSHEDFMRVKAQIYNDARGWDELLNSPQAESEPVDISQIWGNFAHEELHGEMDGGGYALIATVGMSNDYWGYIASFREYQRGDHYRKALTGLGPHSSDFLATRLSRMAAELRGGPVVERAAKDLSYDWDYQHQGARAQALGNAVRQYLPAYEMALPFDGGTPSVVAQPSNVKRFETARVTWIGGSNYVDTPVATVERCTAVVCDPGDPSAWEPFADGSGEVQVKANYPQPQDMAAYRAGLFEWKWEATFETFDSDIALPDARGVSRSQTPSGTYRFVIEGCHTGPAGIATTMSGECDSYDPTGRVSSYRLVSNPFNVSSWDGITVPSITYDGTSVSFLIGPAYPYPISASNTERGPIDYPDTYSSPLRFISGRSSDDVRYGGADLEVFCFHCSFRPWADTGAVTSAAVTVERSIGITEVVAATFDPSTGRWTAAVVLGQGDRAYVSAGGIVDEFGEYNGAASEEVSGG